MVHAFRARTTVRRRVAVRRRLHRRFVTEIRITNAEGFDRAAQGADLAVVIARADIETCQVGGTVARLMLFSDNAVQGHRFAGRMVVQVEGYDDDPRPLLLIPECVRFFRAVNAQWSHWLHFLLPQPDQIKLILLMLVDVDLQEEDRRLPPGYRLRHPAQLGRVLQRLFMSMNVLHETFDVPEAHNEAMTAAVIAALGLVG